MLLSLWQDEAGVIISAELVLVLTITVLMLVVGLHALSKAVTHELNDLAQAFGTISQWYSYDGFVNCHHAFIKGSGFKDLADDCDCNEIREQRPRPKIDNESGVSESGSR